MRARSRLRALGASLVGVLTVLLAPGVAHADPPGPTDFESTVVSITPPTGVIDVSIVGGDAFLAVAVAPGTHVTLAGYQHEPYLEFLPNGEVRENRRSPTYFASQSKTGAAVPSDVTAESPPRWVTVATDGTYAWHDHRAHWMGGTPRGERGDIVADGSVRFVVDGRDVAVRVVTRWLEPASPMPALAGVVVGVAAGAAFVVAGTRRRAWGHAVLLGAATLATIVGFVAYRSVPAVTEPSPFGWVLPATALVAALAAIALERRPASSLFAHGAHALAGVELVIWAFTRRSGLVAAILPTDAPFWVDRAATTAAGAVGLAVAGLATFHLVELVTRPGPRERPAGRAADA